MNEKKKMSKAKRNVLIVIVALLVLLVLVLYYIFGVTNAGKWFLAQFKSDTEEQIITAATAAEATQLIADEGFVLMQNSDSLLPLKTSEEEKTVINLFGMRSISLVYNAGGSSSSNVDACIKLEDALLSENFSLNEDLLYLSYNYYKNGSISIAETTAPANKSASEFIEDTSDKILPEVPAEAYSDTSLYEDGRTVLEHAKDSSDIAMIVIGRGGGEYSDFEPYELRLLEDERAMVEAVCASFNNVILVLNTSNTLEMDFLDEFPSIKSVIWIGYPGQMGINSLARILSGAVNPSGRLADTWLNNNLANPATINYLPLADENNWDKSDGYHYTNAPTDYSYSVQGDGVAYFVNYSEGIYLGYRYFESRFDTDSSYDYDADVRFPFGHGLSYTSFDKSIIGMEESDGTITVRVAVTNSGAVEGKDVIELYYNPPYSGAIEKATVNLIAYKKTNSIAPGETEYYSLSFALEDMASYDYTGYGCYVLEAGEYEIMLRENAHVQIDSVSYELSRDIIYDDAHDGARSTDGTAAVNQFDDAYGNGDYLTRDWNEDARAFTGPKEEDYTASEEVLAALVYEQPTDAELGLTQADMPAYGQSYETVIQLSELAELPKTDPLWDSFIEQLTLEELSSLIGNGAWQIDGIDRLGVPRTLTPDGSTTVTTSLYSGAAMGESSNGITYPCPVVIASAWNEQIAYLMGENASLEAKSFGYAGWYAPAMNTHRTAFNGRNFEYYSEDPLLAGTTAGNVILAASDNGVITFMKHFALNDREANCRQQLFTWSNEQAIREIYLKPFEYAVKLGGSLGAMSSFNYIGTTWAGGNEALLRNVLVDEWGFEGLVITDANMYGYMSTIQMLYAGGDLSLDVMGVYMPGSTSHASILLDSARNGETQIATITYLQESAKDILFAVSRSFPVQGG